MKLSRRAILKLLGLVPAAALLPKVTQPELAKAAAPPVTRTVTTTYVTNWRSTAWSQDMIDDSRVVDWAQALARGAAQMDDFSKQAAVLGIVQWSRTTWSAFARNYVPPPMPIGVIYGDPVHDGESLTVQVRLIGIDPKA